MSDFIQHFSHDHPLESKIPHFLSKISCDLCQLSIHDDQCYSCRTCYYFIHKACAELPQHIHHSLHHQHNPLRLDKVRSSNDTSVCYYCENFFQDHENLAYVCDRCSLHMHVTCALIPLPTITCYSNQDNIDLVQYVCHQNMMTLVEQDDCKSQARCFVCQSFWSGLAYSCTSATCKNFLHKSCAEFPTEIRHPCHLHRPLRLQILKLIKGNSKDVELMALGENLWYQFGTKKEILKENELITLREVFNSLTKEENEILTDTYAFGRPSSYKTQQKEKYRFYRRENSPLFHHELPSIEDIGKINQFSAFGATDLSNFIMELQFFRPRKGLKLDEKYLRQKVVDVHGYMVPITVAPILKTMLHKHESSLFGCGYTSLTRGMKSVTATLQCVAIDRMYKTKIEDVTKDDLKDWFFCLNAIKKITNFGTFQWDHFLERVIAPLFLGFEAIRYEKGICEKLDRKITDLEAELERYKETRNMFKTQTFKRPDEIRDFIVSEALKQKGKYLYEITSSGVEID
ncbi:C1-like [Trema orientale]|uniref:C1-like n=1 Tax=Trema orientale TaxID=63057 RepID=A0A2P5FJZ4_TREOI|nr:C1-like [Trema orientale]